MLDLKKFYCQALCPFLCLCLCVSKSLRKWTQTDTKVTFQPPSTPAHQPYFFWSHMKDMAKISFFYCKAMALTLPWLKDNIHFLSKRQNKNLVNCLLVCLFCLFVCVFYLSACLFCLSVFSTCIFVCPLCVSVLSVYILCLVCLSFVSVCLSFQKWKVHFGLLSWVEPELEECSILFSFITFW